MPSVKLQGSITLPDGSTTGPFTLNIELLPTTVALHVTPQAFPLEGGTQQVDAPVDAPHHRHERRHGNRHS